MNEDWDDGDGELRRKSKQQQKREAEAVQLLGKTIVDLSPAQYKQALARLVLPEKLTEAMEQCRGMKAREARRRQLQYIGKLMRDVDPEPVQQVLEQFRQGSKVARTQLHELENWRERLLTEGDTALQELSQLYPDIDLKHVKQLIKTAQHEAAHRQTPRAARLLFRYLRELLQG